MSKVPQEASKKYLSESDLYSTAKQPYHGNATVKKQCRYSSHLNTTVTPGCTTEDSFSHSSSKAYCDATILFDEGAQRSFNSQTLASELQLPRDYTETVCLAIFGGKNNKIQHMETATVFLITDTHQKISIRMLIASIATSTSNKLLELPYLRILKLIHPIPTRGSRAMTRLPESNSHCRYANVIQHFFQSCHCN